MGFKKVRDPHPAQVWCNLLRKKMQEREWKIVSEIKFWQLHPRPLEHRAAFPQIAVAQGRQLYVQKARGSMEGEGGHFPFSWVRHLENNLFPVIMEPAPSYLATSPLIFLWNLSVLWPHFRCLPFSEAEWPASYYECGFSALRLTSCAVLSKWHNLSVHCLPVFKIELIVMLSFWDYCEVKWLLHLKQLVQGVSKYSWNLSCGY